MAIHSRLWAITCLFNPAGYRVREENYRVFRKHLDLPLVTVELAFDGPFTLSEPDADILIQISGGDRLWQKERLLNLALQALPDECDQVLWIDADIVPCDPAWTSEIGLALERASVVQAFGMVNMLGPSGETMLRSMSTMLALSQIGESELILSATLDRSKGAPCSGHAWAARREVVQEHGFYDGCIVGGGDTAFLCAATGDFEKVIQMHQMGEAQQKRYLDWATKIHRKVTQGVGVLDCEIDHLWHGTLENRKGKLRHIELSHIGFDPYVDVTLDENGVWRWASDRPELHGHVRNYFLARREDEAGILTK
ncbi:MAG: hypothetical protein H7Y17_13615 [Chlorobia bacterium]|nr:hypothetical protein [Fimbriimonadaceae bacterium]